MASCSGKDETDTDCSEWQCSICQDNFKNPKLLPCTHTFCRDCLEGLLRHQKRQFKSTFPCPSCREEIRVPPKGVDGFKTNFYLDAASPAKDKLRLLCKIHTSRPREVEEFCHQCQVCICLKCKLEDHAGHHTEDIEETSKGVKLKLAGNMSGLTSTMAGLKNKMKCFTDERKAIQEKKVAVERDIHRRHKLMVSVADKCREDALFSLDTVCASIESLLEDKLTGLQKTVDELDKVKKRMENCLKGEEGSGLVVTAQDIYQDAGRLEAEVQRVLASQITDISRPVLRYTATADATLSSERGFLSGVSKVDITKAYNIEVTVKQLFRCGDSAEGACEVYSLFPRSDDQVWIAYEVCGISEDSAARHPQLFTLTGVVCDSEKSVKGRTNFTHTSQGSGMCVVQSAGFFQTYAKSRSLVKLKNYLNGTAMISKVIVRREDPLETFSELGFTIQCGPHRAFDVHESRTAFAVVEEAAPPEHQRKVHLYRQNVPRPMATYSSPMQPFQPSDVCFYKLGQQQVLLVSDELNDAIHVLVEEGGQLLCRGYLAAGHPLLTQPTALNTDFKGCLWVGCRTGAVLLCQLASL